MAPTTRNPRGKLHDISLLLLIPPLAAEIQKLRGQTAVQPGILMGEKDSSWFKRTLSATAVSRVGGFVSSKWCGGDVR
jgi:hypothetical protein